MAGASAVQAAKRALVVVLRSLAAVYSITVGVNRDSLDDEVKKGCGGASRKVVFQL